MLAAAANEGVFDFGKIAEIVQNEMVSGFRFQVSGLVIGKQT